MSTIQFPKIMKHCQKLTIQHSNILKNEKVTKELRKS